MYYAVIDIAELIDHFNIPTDTIEEVTAAWGEGEDSYGVCLTTLDGYYLLAYDDTCWPDRKDHFSCYHRLEKEYSPNDIWLDQWDWEDNPTDIARWLEEGGLLEDAHEY